MLPRAYVRAGDRDARREAAVRTPGATPAPPRSLRTVVVSHATTAVREARCVPKAWGSPATRCTARPAAAPPPADWSQQHGRCEGRRQAVQIVQCPVQRAMRATRHARSAPPRGTAWHAPRSSTTGHPGRRGDRRGRGSHRAERSRTATRGSSPASGEAEG